MHAGYQVTIRCLHDTGLAEEEMIDGIKIERIVHTSQSYTKSLAHKIYLLLLFIKRSLRGVKSFDYIHCHDLSTLPIGVWGKLFGKRGVKVIYDSHEYAIEQNRKQKRLKPYLKCLEGFCIRYADGVINVSDSIANEYVRLYGIKKPYVVLNTPPLQEPAPHNKFREKFNIAPDAIIFLYQGGFSPNRGIEMTLEAFAAESDPKKVIVLMGYGALEPMVKQAAEQHQNIFYHEAVSPDILLDYTSSADIGILYYENDCLNHYYCSPNKFFEYTMAGLPVIVSNLYELGRLVRTHENGIVVPEDTAQALGQVVAEITPQDIARMKDNTAAMRQIYNWEEQEKTLLRLYNSI